MRADYFQSRSRAKRFIAASRRAIAEAEARRARQAGDMPRPREHGGREGLEPTRYGDWESRGIVSDF